MENPHNYGHGIYCVDAAYIKEQLAAVYIVVEGSEIAIIETATSHSVPIILKALSGLGLQPEMVKYIIPTHIHLDHAGGCGALLKHCPHATVLIHPRGERHLINPSKLIAGAKAVYGDEKFTQLYGHIEAIDSQRIKVQEDNSVVMLGQRQLQFLHTEGHAKHHFCIFDEISKSIFTGDTFGLSYPALNKLSTINTDAIVIPTTTPIHFNPNKMKKSLVSVMAHNPEKLFLTHFGVIEHISSAYLQLLFWISFYDGLVHNAIRENTCTENYFFNNIRYASNEIFAKSHGITSQQIQTHLEFDLRLNAQGLYHYSQTL